MNEAVVFAQGWMRATGMEHVTLTSIPADGGATTTRTFPKTEAETSMAGWVAAENDAGKNIYFQANETPSNCSSKAAKSDMISVVCRHADIDPVPERPLQQERSRLLVLAESLRHDAEFPPTVIIDSGGGVQCLWACERSQSGAEGWDHVELQNRAIEAAVGAGGTHDVSRLLRMPGTMNYPNAKKRKHGRVPAPARLLHQSERVYTQDEIAQAIPAWATRIAATGRVAPKSTGTQPAAEVARRQRGDGDRSAAAFTLAGRVKAFSGTYERFVEALDGNADTAAWKAEKGLANGGRELRRAWDRAGSQGAQGGGAGYAEGLGMPEAHAAPEYSDEALALAFADRHHDRIRYVAAWKRWMVYEGPRWRQDTTLAVVELIRRECRAAADRCRFSVLGHTRARQVASEKTVSAVERLARADRRLAATADDWDTDPWLLNTPDGVLDLRNGTTRQHDATDMMTKLVAVGPGGGCPTWMGFLDRITNRDRHLQTYLQRIAGYALTGSTQEDALFFGYGTGANGKSVFLNTLTHIMGNYATVADMNVFTANGEQHPTGLAALQGARLVVANETEEGARLAEARLKAITGGDPITARFMRQDFYTFIPVCKLFMAGNHQPALRNVDTAMRRRFNLVPFTVTIPPQERDRNLPDKLRAEAPGILAWMLQGCLMWQQHGLQPPPVVVVATEAYLASQDAIRLWIEDCCECSADHKTGSSDLWASYRFWAAAGNEFIGTQKRFSQALQTKGFQKGRDPTSGRSAFCGLRLKTSVPGAGAA